MKYPLIYQLIILCLFLLISPAHTPGQILQPQQSADLPVYLETSATPDLNPVMAVPASELKEVVAHYSADRDGLRRR